MHAAEPVAAAASSVPPEGVQLIHVIPAGISCVRDQISMNAPLDGRYDALLSAVYKDDLLAQTLVEANDLVPDATGQVSVYVPPGLPVVVPAMCYFKENASAVTLQANGTPGSSGPSAADTAMGWLILAVVLIGVALLIKKLA